MAEGVWPKTVCAGFWLKSVCLPSAGRGRGQQRQDVPTSIYDTEAPAWFGEPEFEALIRTGGEALKPIVGTLRARGKSGACVRVTDGRKLFKNNMCEACAEIESTRAFQDHVRIDVNRTSADPPPAEYVDSYCPKTKNNDLSRQHLEHKAAVLAEKLNLANLKLMNAKELAATLVARTRSAAGLEAEGDEVGALLRMAKELEELSKGKGSPEEIAALLITAQARFVFSTDADGACKHDTFLGVFSDSVYNLDRPPKGHRYCSSTKYLFAAISVRYGPAAAKFVALNVGGPMETTTKKVIPKYKNRVGMAGVEKVVRDAVPMYKALMLREKIALGSVHVKLAEDETATLRELHWNEENDTLEGSCGLKTKHIGTRHRCVDDCVIPIQADGKEGFQIIVDAFGSHQIGDYGRLMMFNPCHKQLPPIAILIVATCNRFDREYVQRQWTCIADICNKYLGHIVGMVSGHDSDGDSRRRSLQQVAMLSDFGVRYYPAGCPGFIYTARLTTWGEQIGDTMDEEEEWGQSAECPNGHPLQKLQTDAEGYGCDTCETDSIAMGTSLHSCRLCDYDVCQDCIADIREPDEAAQEEADQNYEVIEEEVATQEAQQAAGEDRTATQQAQQAAGEDRARTERAERVQRRNRNGGDGGDDAAMDEAATGGDGLTGADDTATDDAAMDDAAMDEAATGGDGLTGADDTATSR